MKNTRQPQQPYGIKQAKHQAQHTQKQANSTTMTSETSSTKSTPSSDIESQRDIEADGRPNHQSDDHSLDDNASTAKVQFWATISEIIKMFFTATAPPRPPSKLKIAILTFTKLKIAIITFFMIWVQVHYLGPAFASLPALSSSPLAIESITILTVVFSTEFIWMPLAMFVLRPCLFPSEQEKDSEGQRIVIVAASMGNETRTTELQGKREVELNSDSRLTAETVSM